MMTQNELYTALMNGADPTKLAQDYADMLNAAIDQKKAEDERIQKEKDAKAKAAAKQAELEAEKIADAQKILDVMIPYFEKYHPNCKIKMSAKDFVTAINSVVDETYPLLFSMIQNLEDAFGMRIKPRTESKTKMQDPLEKFLSEYGLM